MKCSRRTCVSARWPFALFRLIGRSAVALGRRTSATSKRSASGTITRQSAPAETRAIRTAKRAGARWRTARRRALSLGVAPCVRTGLPLVVPSGRPTPSSATLACVHERRSAPRVRQLTTAAPELHGTRQRWWAVAFPLRQERRGPSCSGGRQPPVRSEHLPRARPWLYLSGLSVPARSRVLRAAERRTPPGRCSAQRPVPGRRLLHDSRLGRRRVVRPVGVGCGTAHPA